MKRENRNVILEIRKGDGDQNMDRSGNGSKPAGEARSLNSDLAAAPVQALWSWGGAAQYVSLSLLLKQEWNK